ncbi:competence/damage-inducible protein A [Williamsia herbipolensis]|uniref:competence/damage-inducible protein A n=1 Tax=Williamsia herbipolensis TaxID=1603258 RepID=UPI0005F7CD51|nr:competence/damage-inducible protein A [Williamsia herbipolensis]
MSVRAGIVVTGTEVLTGRVADANGPWLARQLGDAGIELAHITVCGDRPADMEAQLRFLADDGVDLILTSGGLGPTADDLTVEIVARFTGRELVLETALEETIGAVVNRWMAARGDTTGLDSVAAATRKQAMIPAGAQWVTPTGTAPGVVVSGTDTLPTVVVLPGPPPELQAMWPAVVEVPAVAAILASAPQQRQETVRMIGLPESELAVTLRTAESTISGFDRLEITTCLRRAELEIVTRIDTGADDAYAALLDLLQAEHGRAIFSVDGSTVDDQVAGLLSGRLVATAESCTAGLVAGRLTDRAGSSAYVVGGAVAYSNEIKTEVLGVDADLIAAHGAVSEQVAAAMATGALRRFGVDTAISTTGIAGPGGGTPEKPVGTVCFGIALGDGTVVTRTLVLPGSRADVRNRSTSVALHLLRQVLTAQS